MGSPIRLPRLYAILDVERASAEGLDPLDVARRWLDRGVTWLQLRAKTLPGGAFLDVADRLAELANAASATFIVNDRSDIARLSGAAGVHVGQDDLSPADARRVLGLTAIVGRSTHTEAQVLAALAEPIDYLAIGPVFTTTSKERPDPVVGLEGVRLARALAESKRMPLVAIGGITLERSAEVIEAGADAVAVIGDLLTADPGARAEAFINALG